MDLLQKLRTLLGALAHKPQARPSPHEDVDKGPEVKNERPAVLPARPALQGETDGVPEEARVADLIEQQKAALERSQGAGNSGPVPPATS